MHSGAVPSKRQVSKVLRATLSSASTSAMRSASPKPRRGTHSPGFGAPIEEDGTIAGSTKGGPPGPVMRSVALVTEAGAHQVEPNDRPRRPRRGRSRATTKDEA